MSPHAPALRMAAGAVLLLLLAPTALSQDALPDPQSQAFGFAVRCDPSFVEVPYLGSADYECAVHDISTDGGYVPMAGVPGQPYSSHMVTLEQVAVSPPEAQGWQLLIGRPDVPTYGGAVVDVPINVKTTPQINVPHVTFQILATFRGPNGYTSQQNFTLSAQVARYDMAYAEVLDKVKKAGQDEDVQFVLQVTNFGVYPDVFEFTVHSDDSTFQVTTPAGVYVPPLSVRNVTINVQTPNDKVYELGRTTLVYVTARSTTGTGVYSSTGILKVEGAYVPVHWIPLLLVGLVSAMVVVRSSREKLEIRRLEKGRPRRPRPTPRQAVLLAELKRKDPEAYKARVAAMEAVYKERRGAFLAAYAARKVADREERRQAKAEYEEARKRQKVEEKARRTREKREAKARKILERKEAKLRKRKEKELAKKRKVLLKKQAKLAKKQAKADKKQAKIDAKLAAREAKAQAKADKEAQRRAKAEAKAARKRGGGNP